MYTRTHQQTLKREDTHWQVLGLILAKHTSESFTNSPLELTICLSGRPKRKMQIYTSFKIKKLIPHWKSYSTSKYIVYMKDQKFGQGRTIRLVCVCLCVCLFVVCVSVCGCVCVCVCVCLSSVSLVISCAVVLTVSLAAASPRAGAPLFVVNESDKLEISINVRPQISKQWFSR